MAVAVVKDKRKVGDKYSFTFKVDWNIPRARKNWADKAANVEVLFIDRLYDPSQKIEAKKKRRNFEVVEDTPPPEAWDAIQKARRDGQRYTKGHDVDAQFNLMVEPEAAEALPRPEARTVRAEVRPKLDMTIQFTQEFYETIMGMTSWNRSIVSENFYDQPTGLNKRAEKRVIDAKKVRQAVDEVLALPVVDQKYLPKDRSPELGNATSEIVGMLALSNEVNSEFLNFLTEKPLGRIFSGRRWDREDFDAFMGNEPRALDSGFN